MFLGYLSIKSNVVLERSNKDKMPSIEQKNRRVTPTNLEDDHLEKTKKYQGTKGERRDLQGEPCQTEETMSRVRNWVVRVREILLILFFRSAWTGEGERKNNSKFTDPNYPISDSDHEFTIT